MQVNCPESVSPVRRRIEPKRHHNLKSERNREHVSRLWNTIDAIGRKWLRDSGYEVAPDALGFFERYDEDFDPQTGTGGMEVWMPVKAWFCGSWFV
jgi:AraC family transcriptional regulator